MVTRNINFYIYRFVNLNDSSNKESKFPTKVVIL